MSDDLTLFPDDAFRRPSLPSSISEETPKVFVAMPLTDLTADARAVVKAVSQAVCHAVLSTSENPRDPWCIAVHSPLDWSDPHGPAEHTEEQVFDLNEEEVLAKSDALIAIGYRGGSVGVGMEISWALQRGIPVLYLEIDDSTASRQVTGTTRFSEVTITRRPDEPDAAAKCVQAWLQHHRSAIADGPRRRRNAEITWLARQAHLREAWEALVPDQRDATCALAGIARITLDRLLTRPALVLAYQPAQVYLMLEQALGVRGASEPRMPELSEIERGALASAAVEAGWTAGQVLAYEHEARQELAKGGIRRLSFSSIQDWHRLADRR